MRVKNKLKASYRYNGLGQRVLKTDAVTPANSRQYVYDSAGHLLGEYTLAGAAVKEYVWLDDTLVAILSNFDGSTYQFVETDHLGTPRAVVHPTENTILWRWDLTPSAFGEHLPNGNPDGDAFTYTLNLRYPGQYYDAESGLHYNYFRDYEPATGRYVESDPIGLGGGTSTYGYSGGNALASIDPLGLNYWKGSIQLGQFGYSNRGIGVTNQGFSMNLEMPIGQCDFYGKRYRVRMKSSKDWHWGKKETFVGQGKVTLDDGNQAFEREALVGSFSLRVAKGSKTGTIMMGRNRIGNVTFPYAPQREDLVIDGTLSYFTATGFANADGVEERKCDCDQSADPGFRANGAWRQDDKY